MSSQLLSHTSNESAFNKLRNRLGCEWPIIQKAAEDAAQEREKIWNSIKDDRLLSGDNSLVVFGSLGRDEWTSGSDVDWTLLVDGQADSGHLEAAHTIGQKLEDLKLKKPGPTGVFGNLAFSHEIIHQIGGENDTNRNTTQRMLLLLESTPIGNETGAYERVIRGVLERYLENIPSTINSDSQKLPRFLINDLVRFWRTMAVDFASKQRERMGQGWGLRNAKLRFSRKLIFASGLITCYSPILNPTFNNRKQLIIPDFVNHFMGYIARTPIDIIAEAWLKVKMDNSAKRMFDTYELFLKMIDDSRDVLEHLKIDTKHSDPNFQKMKEQGEKFQSSLIDLFFNNDKLFQLTKEYCVF